jgi:hypothetical protein
MSAREVQRRAEQSRQSVPTADRKIGINQHQVLRFSEWCLLNGISPATGRRILRSGHGPVILKLSARRIGITVAANTAWQAKRAITA